MAQRFAKGYDQMLGRRFDEGIELSGGEWQKVALARAYLREAQVLILDEPTASLDARAEYEVFLRFAELTGGKAAVLISHRFSTVRMAERILVLEKGQIVEQGSHEELVAQGRDVRRTLQTTGCRIQIAVKFPDAKLPVVPRRRARESPDQLPVLGNWSRTLRPGVW